MKICLQNVFQTLSLTKLFNIVKYRYLCYLLKNAFFNFAFWFYTFCQLFFVTWFDKSISFPNCNRNWRIANKKCSWQEFKHYLILGLAYLGVSISCFRIHKSSWHFNQNFKVSLSIVWILLSCSINGNFACRLNECPSFLKCKSKDASAFWTYWTLHDTDSIK